MSANDLDRKATSSLWADVNRRRGSMDVTQYKEFVLGLVFLRYVSDAFEERREAIRAELVEQGIEESRRDSFLDDQDEYTGHGVFWVPEPARWGYLAQRAKSGGVGELLDSAMDAVMASNDSLRGVLPKIFNRDNVDRRRLAELVDLISDARFTGHGDRSARERLGSFFDDLVHQFAAEERRSPEESPTPQSVSKLLVEMLEPHSGRVYDPCCGSGGMFVQAQEFVLQQRGRRDDISVFGQESNERTWRLAKMNLAIHGIYGDLGPRWEDAFYADRHPDVLADFVLANPPFNKNWKSKSGDPRWAYGVPPAGNANFAWLQHIVSKLKQRGVAGVVLANGSMSSKQSGEGQIRAAMVEADLVVAMVALPPQLFIAGQNSACLWLLAKEKGPQGSRRLADRRGETLFIDASSLGTMVDRTERVLTPEEIWRIADTYHAWRGHQSAKDKAYEDVPGFCRSVMFDEIRVRSHVLVPGLYIDPVEREDTTMETVLDEIRHLREKLYLCLKKSARLDSELNEKLGRLDV